MSIVTAAQHTAAELRFVTLDESGELAYFHSDSRSNPRRPNVTVLDISTGEAFCFCRAAECHHDCWHVAHVAEAWRTVAHRVRCQTLPLSDLVAHGQSLVKHILAADAAGQLWIAANLRQLLDTARIVWKERAAQAAPAPTAFVGAASMQVAA